MLSEEKRKKLKVV